MVHVFWHWQRHQVKQLADYRWVQRAGAERLEHLKLLERFGTCVSLKRFELSEAVELLERLEPALFDEHQGITHSPRVEKGNKEILTGTSVPLDTCLLMGDPGPRSVKEKCIARAFPYQDWTSRRHDQACYLSVGFRRPAP